MISRTRETFRPVRKQLDSSSAQNQQCSNRMNVTVSIPDQLVDQLAKGGRPIEDQLMIDLALDYYRLGLISLGEAVELSGLRRAESESLLAEHRIERPGSLEQLQTDLDWARKVE